ncbi:hypothetical protein ES319_D11G349200v1 [Gossypium barbadense]|uniref:Uncharacterized protein n=1 Tax=Gossypium barbadense TaxID=3634 RepID=A0A5J5PIV2_GOSBA|nr:hypothetical protein ES319_1Z033100v1 [Gossypium barbadense]KAB2006489.1 hypothetical protein ES319_D11G349200v1 [Gossypium barbadense]
MGFYCGQTDRRIDGLLGFSVSTEDWCLSDEMQSLARPEGFLPVASERSRADILVVINETEKASEGFRFLRCLGKRKVCLGVWIILLLFNVCLLHIFCFV